MRPRVRFCFACPHVEEEETMVGNRILRHTGIFAAFALARLSAATSAQQRHVPVIAGQNPGYDACGTVGVVRGLDPQGGEGFLAGPSSDYAMLDKVHNGDLLNICDQSVSNGNWLGGVYSHDGRDCGVGTPRPRAAAYAGPCSSGWVYRKFVADYAG
jgi:hypothetical protein